MPDPQIFRLGQHGLARVMGELEALVMEAAWSAPGELSVQEACDRLGPDHHYKTVMTIMNRLVQKGLLTRRLEGRAYLYQPRMPREEFLKSVAGSVLQGAIQEYGEVAVAAFVDTLEAVSPETLDRLERLLRNRKRSQQPKETPREGGQGRE